MKKLMLTAAIPAALALTACGDAATEEEAPAGATAMEDDDDAPEPVAKPVAEEEAPAGATAMEDDDDAPEPVAEPVAEEEPHDESVAHDH